MNKNFQLMDLADLDPISFAEVLKIIDTYEMIHIWCEMKVEKAGGLNNPEAYETVDDYFKDVKQTNDIKKRRGILEQIRDENLGDKKK